MLFMKSFVSSFAFITFFSGAAYASGYPPEYTYQTIGILSKGPALMAHASAGCKSIELVVAYKGTGTLAEDNPDFINALVMVEIVDKEDGGRTLYKTSVLRLGREWHGSGYMSEPQPAYFFKLVNTSYFEVKTIKLAFFSKDKWDSDFGRNYVFEAPLNPSKNADFDFDRLQIKESNCLDIPFAGWDFIIQHMKDEPADLP